MIGGTEQLWREPESGWCRPEVVAVALGLDLRRLAELAEEGQLERRESDGAIWVDGHDADPLSFGEDASADEAINAVGEALSAVSGELSTAQREGALNPTLPCVPDADDTPPPLPLDPQADPKADESNGRTRFAFPFGIAL